jgi:hypothetical protein
MLEQDSTQTFPIWSQPPCGKPIELQDEARVGQQGTLTRVWAERGSRPRGAPRPALRLGLSVRRRLPSPRCRCRARPLAHPGGNATGFATSEFSIAGKWADLLKQIKPTLAHVALMFNPTTSPQSKIFLNAIESAAPALGVDVTPLPVQTAADIEPAIAGFASRPNGGLVIGTDGFLVSNRATVVELAAGYRLPAVYAQREYAPAGGLMRARTDPRYSIGVATHAFWPNS